MNNNLGGSTRNPFMPSQQSEEKNYECYSPSRLFASGHNHRKVLAEVLLESWTDGGEDLWTPPASSYNSLFQDDTFHRTSLFLAVLFIRNKLREKEFYFLFCYILVVYLHIHTHTYIYLLIHRYMHNRTEMN